MAAEKVLSFGLPMPAQDASHKNEGLDPEPTNGII